MQKQNNASWFWTYVWYPQAVQYLPWPRRRVAVRRPVAALGTCNLEGGGRFSQSGYVAAGVSLSVQQWSRWCHTSKTPHTHTHTHTREAGGPTADLLTVVRREDGLVSCSENSAGRPNRLTAVRPTNRAWPSETLMSSACSGPVVSVPVPFLCLLPCVCLRACCAVLCCAVL
ncbi:hypothetical protein V8C34DRAFT_176171 [Trichoderma compactum]